MVRAPTPEAISGWRIGRSASSPRKRRNQRTPSPRTTWSASMRSREAGMVGDVPADDDRGLGLVLADQLAHLRDLADVGHDRADADHVVAARVRSSSTKRSRRGEVEQRAGRLDVGLDQHQAPRAMEHAQRERALHARHLVVVQLHRVDGAAAVLVVLGVGTEDAREEDAGPHRQAVARPALGRGSQFRIPARLPPPTAPEYHGGPSVARGDSLKSQPFRLTLRAKILSVVLLCVGIPVVMMGRYLLDRNEEILAEKVRETVSNHLFRKASQLDDWMWQRTREVSRWSASFVVFEGVEALTRGTGDVDRARRDLNKYLASVLGHYQTYESLFVIDLQGRILASTRPEEWEAWARPCSRRPEAARTGVVSPLHARLSWERPHLLALHAIQDPNDRTVGYFVERPDLRELQLLLGPPGGDPGAGVLAARRRGRVLLRASDGRPRTPAPTAAAWPSRRRPRRRGRWWKRGCPASAASSTACAAWQAPRAATSWPRCPRTRPTAPSTRRARLAALRAARPRRRAARQLLRGPRPAAADPAALGRGPPADARRDRRLPPGQGQRRAGRPHPDLQRDGGQDARRAAAPGVAGHHRRADRPLQPPPLPGHPGQGDAAQRAGRHALSLLSSTSTTSSSSTTGGATPRATPSCGRVAATAQKSIRATDWPSATAGRSWRCCCRRAPRTRPCRWRRRSAPP